MKIVFKQDIKYLPECLQNIPRYYNTQNCLGPSMSPEKNIREGDYVGQWVKLEDVVRLFLNSSKEEIMDEEKLREKK